MWVKKGDKLPDGSIAKRGIVVQRSSGKRLTGSVKLVEGTKRGKAGDTLSLKAGRYTKAGSGSKTTAGVGGTGNKPPSPVKSSAPTGKAANALARSNKATVAAQSGYTAGSKGNGYTKLTKPKNGFPSGGRAGNAFTRNAGKDAWDMDKPYSAAQVANAGLIAASFLPVVGPAARGARAAVAARGAAQAGLRNMGSKGAQRNLAAAISKVKTAPPKPTAPVVKTVAKPTASVKNGGIGATKKGINPETGSTRATSSKVPMRPANPTPAQKGSLTRYANKRAAEKAAAVKSKGGKKK
jgi:hypothetical protein